MKTPQQTAEFVNQILTEINAEEYQFQVRQKGNEVYLMASYDEPCVITGTLEEQKTRKWVISPHAVKSEIVQTAFKCVLTSMEHRAREKFQYKNARVFGPHFNVDSLVEICQSKENFEIRPKP